MSFHAPEKYRFSKPGHEYDSDASYGNNGMFFVPRNGRMGAGGFKEGSPFKIICSDGDGWEHVSISLPTRCPTWEEMCRIKDLFWDETDCVIQYHPPKSDYVNNHPFCLHLWRPVDAEIPRPPVYMVGALA